MNLHNISIDIIRAGQTPDGAYIAAPTFPQYQYSWLRDGTWIAYGMDCAGEHDSARAFYQWVGHTLSGQQAKLESLLEKLAHGKVPDESDYLPTRFTLDGEIGDEFWWNFQLDGYGAWLWGLVAHIELTGDASLLSTLLPAVKLTVSYLAALWQSPNYDCWEENRPHIHTSTLATIYGGLNAIQRIDSSLVSPDLPATIRSYVLQNCVAADGHFAKFLGNDAVDANLLWIAVPYRLAKMNDDRFARTLTKIERDLRRTGGGVYRYAADTYYGGGEWVLLTAWLGWVYVELGQIDRAQALLKWIEAQARLDGTLPEQVSEHLLDNSRYAEWEQRWGKVACPLLWSHAMYLILESQLGRNK